MSRVVLSDPKLTPCQFQRFPRRRNCFHFQNFRDVPMRKEQQSPPWSVNLAKIWSKHVLRTETKNSQSVLDRLTFQGDSFNIK